MKIFVLSNHTPEYFFHLDRDFKHSITLVKSIDELVEAFEKEMKFDVVFAGMALLAGVRNRGGAPTKALEALSEENGFRLISFIEDSSNKLILLYEGEKTATPSARVNSAKELDEFLSN